jgi:molybdopterin/thiamine biosynthesis adenylyltransferase
VEARHTRIDLALIAVVSAQLLGVELLPAVALFGIGRIRVLLSERPDTGLRLSVHRVHARR